jgi:tetratricopeptide (TPR) repeat protein
MSRKRKSAVEEFVVVTEKPRTKQIAAAAFLAGAFLMWLGLRLFGPPPATQPRQNTGEAPDVSQMTPAQAASALGNWEYDHANWAAAAEQYRRALAAGADTPDIHTDLGTAYRYLGEGDKALEQYGIAQRKAPFHQNSLLNQAIVYAELLHDHPHAIATAREFLRRFPQGKGAESARKLIEELEAGHGEAEKKLSEFLSSPRPTKATP